MKDVVRTFLTDAFAGDEAFLTDVYAQYAADMKKSAAQLKTVHATGDAETLAQVAHAMKGMALQVGDGEISSVCYDVQTAAQAGDLARVGELLPTIGALVTRL